MTSIYSLLHTKVPKFFFFLQFSQKIQWYLNWMAKYVLLITVKNQQFLSNYFQIASLRHCILK